MKKIYVTLTDSGDDLEGALFIGKPVLVSRKVTKCPETYEEGVPEVIGPHRGSIGSQVSRPLTGRDTNESMPRVAKPYGDGNASACIVQALPPRPTGVK